jgi:hypothetical protein
MQCSFKGFKKLLLLWQFSPFLVFVFGYGTLFFTVYRLCSVSFLDICSLSFLYKCSLSFYVYYRTVAYFISGPESFQNSIFSANSLIFRSSIIVTVVIDFTIILYVFFLEFI